MHAKLHFITHFFLKILLRNNILVILSNLHMAGYTHLKWYYQVVENFCVYLQKKKHGFIKWQLTINWDSWQIHQLHQVTP